MLKYLVIQLADDCVSYCHYENNSKCEQLISSDTLKEAIRFGMVENLNIQFVYPQRALPEGYNEIIESIDHTKIMPYDSVDADKADIVVCNGLSEIESYAVEQQQIVILRLGRNEMSELPRVYASLNGKCMRLNVVIIDVDKFSDSDFEQYRRVLTELGNTVKSNVLNGTSTQLNLLLDRMLLKAMNNCNAGDETITLMPNGKFYPCTGFYYDNPDEDFGDLVRGVDIKNRQLFKLGYAPICRNCDAYQCKRCVWLNRKTTNEVNTPSHEQCVVSHLERNASRDLLYNVRNYGDFLSDTDMAEIEYLDPFDVRKKW